MTEVYYSRPKCEFGHCKCGYPGGCVYARYEKLTREQCPECSKRVAAWGGSIVRTWHSDGVCIRCMKRLGVIGD